MHDKELRWQGTAFPQQIHRYLQGFDRCLENQGRFSRHEATDVVLQYVLINPAGNPAEKRLCNPRLPRCAPVNQGAAAETAARKFAAGFSGFNLPGEITDKNAYCHDMSFVLRACSEPAAWVIDFTQGHVRS
jgi:hypothetical protein